MSMEEGKVGADTFATVDPRNSGKLDADLAQLAGRLQAHRYVFFMSPLFPANERRPTLERGDVQVWSVDVQGERSLYGCRDH
jgi:hypothetical protein